MAADGVFREKIGAMHVEAEAEAEAEANAASRPNIGPHERLLWSNRSIALGSFDSSPDDEDFETAGEIGDRPAIAFSRTAVGIAHEKRAPIVSDGTVAVLHNPRYPYRRFRVDARGDHSEWVSIDPELLLGLNRRLGSDARRPFAASTAALGRRAAALLRLVVRHLRDWSPPDPLWVEETLFEVVSALGPHGDTPKRPRASARHDRFAHRVREILASRSEQPWSVTSIAKVMETSPFHACRVFRSRTGYTLHGYLTEQRLRRALTRLEDGQDLREIAVRLGFANHSHFTAHFRSAFGVTPSQFRRRATPAAVRELAERLRGTALSA
jgi:AraC-like DNA-binding protein